MAEFDHIADKPRYQLRFILTVALSFSAVLVAVVGIIAFWGLDRMHQTTQQAVVVDAQISHLANKVVIQALLCRHYEQDFFSTIDNINQRTEALAKWEASSASLLAAIDAFDAAATQPVDHHQAAIWREARTAYTEHFYDIADQIQARKIILPAVAREEMASTHENMHVLNKLALGFAEDKAALAQQWEESVAETFRLNAGIVGVLSILAMICAIAWSFVFTDWLMEPIDALHAATTRLTGGDLDSRVIVQRRDELGMLGHSFNRMATTIQERTHDLEAQYVQATMARKEAELAHLRVSEQMDVIARQQSLIQEMSVPILPLTESTMVIPLVGALDANRLALIQERALESLEQSSARYVILDTTGVSVVDTAVAQGLMRIVQAAGLLGTKVVIVGIRPEMAQTIVGLGISLDGVITRRSLQEGVTYTLRQ